MRSFLVFWLLLVTGLAQAQFRKPDTIVKTNAASLTGYVVRVTETKIQYRLSAKADAVLHTLPRSQVRSIRYSSGKTVQITARTLLPAQSTPADSPARLSDVLLPDSSTVATATTPLSSTGGLPANTPEPEQPVPALHKMSYHYTAVTLGAEGNYVVPALSPQWADDAIGLGIRQGMGGSLLVTRRFNRWVGLAVQLSYGRWMAERRYYQDGVFLYGADEKLEYVSVEAGTKIYVVGGLYIQPELILQLRRLTSTTTESHPISSLNKSQSELTWGYGGELGYEYVRGRFIAKLAIGYTYLRTGHKPLVWYYPLTSPLQTVDIQLGIGFTLPASRPLNPATR